MRGANGACGSGTVDTVDRNGGNRLVICGQIAQEILKIGNTDSRIPLAQKLGVLERDLVAQDCLGVEVGQSRECDRAAKRAEIGLPEDAVAIVSAGILNKNKNNHVVIESLALLENKNVYYVICGEGDEEGALRELAEKNGVGDRVLFLGFRTDMKQIMLACDIFAMPSFREGVPRALLEAMDLGLPCIGTRTRGIRELIGNDDLLCSPTSAKEYAKAIEFVINSPDGCRSIIERNVEEAKLYSKERVRAEYAAIYEEVLK